MAFDPSTATLAPEAPKGFDPSTARLFDPSSAVPVEAPTKAAAPEPEEDPWEWRIQGQNTPPARPAEKGPDINQRVVEPSRMAQGFIRGATEGFQATPPILTEKGEQILRKHGFGANTIGFINSPSYALGAVNALWHGGISALFETLAPVIGQQGARDLVSVPDAFMGMPHPTGIPHREPLPPHEAAAMREAKGYTESNLTFSPEAGRAPEEMTPEQQHWADIRERQAAQDQYWPDRSTAPRQITGPESRPASPEAAAVREAVVDQQQAERTQPTTAQGAPPPADTTPTPAPVAPPAPVESTPPALAAPAPRPAPRPPLETPPVIPMPGPTPPAVETVAPPTTPTEVAPGVVVDTEQAGQPAPVPQVAPTIQPTAPTSVAEPAVIPVDALPPPGQPSPTPPPDDGYLVRLPPDAMKVDPKTFQYKESDEQGVTGKYSHVTKWEPTYANPLIVWQDRAGQFYVGDGHQRHDIATRATAAGQQGIQMLSRVFREADGFTPEFVRMLAAYRNITEGSGTAIDAAKVIRGKNSLPKEWRLPDLDMRGQMAAQGEGLSKLSDEALGVVINGVVPEGNAAHVGALISDPVQQMAALRVLAKADPTPTIEQARLIVEDVKAAGYTKELESGQTDMGDILGPSVSALFPERARVLDKAQKSLGSAKALYGAAVRGEDTLTKAGNVLDKEGNIRAKTENEQLLDILKRSARSRGPVSEALTAAARELADGKKLDGVASAFLTQVRAIVRRGEGEGIQPGAAADRTGPEGEGEGPEGPVEGQGGFFAGRRIPREPTIRNDPNQVEMPGMRPSAAQAQIARDQTGTGRLTKPNQKAADEGLFAPRVEQSGLFDTPAPTPPAAAPPVSKWVQNEGPDFVDELHLVPDLDGGQAGAADWVFTRGRETGFEHIAVVENATGRIVHAGTIGNKNQVAFARENAHGVTDAYTVHHNHPNGTAISGGDVSMLTTPGISHVVAHTPEGHTFTAVLEMAKADRSEDPYLARGLGNTLKAAHKALENAMVPIFVDLVKRGEMTREQSNIAYGDALNRLFHQMGVINYTSTFEMPQVALDALKANGYELHDRYGVAVPPEERFAGLPERTGSAPAAAPAGGQGGVGERPAGVERSGQGRLFRLEADKLEALPPLLKNTVDWVNNQPSYQEKRDALIEFIAPMRLGPKETTNEAFKFANEIRRGQREFGQYADNIRDTQTVSQRWEIGRAHAEQSVFERKLARDLAAQPPAQRPAYEANMRARFDATGIGHAGLGPEGLRLVQGLSVIQEKLWNELKSREMVDPNAEGWAYWMPRQFVIMEPGKKARRIIKDDALIPGSSGKSKYGRTPTPDMHPFGTNLHTDVPGFRNYEEIEASLRAARAKYGPNVQIVDDIMGLVGALQRVQASIAGHDLIQAIVAYGNRLGSPTALLGGGPRDGFFMPGHSSMYKVVPKFVQENGRTVVAQTPSGQPVFEKQAIWIDNAFKPALDAVFRAPPGGLAKAFMALKAVSTHFVMQSPLIHLQVELGRALPLKAGRQFVVGMLGVGRRARQAGDPRIDLLVQHGMAPVVKGFIGDPVSLMNEANYKSPFGAVGDAISDFRSLVARGLRTLPAGDTLAKLVTRPIQTLLWNRVLDLQIAIGLGMAEDRLAAGWSETAAYTAAAHLANRYAGALPPEGMSRLANTLANVFLFSRSFTGGNIGVIKDTATGAPKHVLSHIGIDAGAQAEAEAREWLKSKARRTFLYDIALYYFFATAIQHIAGALLNDNEESIGQGYVRRFHEAANYVSEHPIKSIMFPPNVLEKLLPMADNEPGKENRSRIMPLAGSPQWTYLRTPAGKVGEEFLDWITDAPGTLARKQSTIAKGAYEAIISGKDSFGRDITRPGKDQGLMNLWRRSRHFLGAVFPIELEHDIMTALGNPGSSMLGKPPPTGKERILAGVRAGLNISGLGSLSRGYPYGPVAGGDKLREDQIKFDAGEIMPQVKRLVDAGKSNEALDMLIKAGEDPSRASRIVGWFDPKAGDYAAGRSTHLGEKRAAHRGDMEQIERNDIIRRSYGLTPKTATQQPPP